MADDTKKPSGGVPISRLTERTSPRTHRDHAKERRISESDARPPFVDEEYTGKYDGDELEELRKKRPTDVRIARLELKADELRRDLQEEVNSLRSEFHSEMGDVRSDLGKVSVAVADMGGQFKVIPQLVDTMQGAIDALRQREHVTFKAKVDIDKAKELDNVEAGKVKREWVTKVLAIVSSIAAIIATVVAAGKC